jgi:hypothetical protein
MNVSLVRKLSRGITGGNRIVRKSGRFYPSVESKNQWTRTTSRQIHLLPLIIICWKTPECFPLYASQIAPFVSSLSLSHFPPIGDNCLNLDILWKKLLKWSPVRCHEQCFTPTTVGCNLHNEQIQEGSGANQTRVPVSGGCRVLIVMSRVIVWKLNECSNARLLACERHNALVSLYYSLSKKNLMTVF